MENVLIIENFVLVVAVMYPVNETSLSGCY